MYRPPKARVMTGVNGRLTILIAPGGGIQSICDHQSVDNIASVAGRRLNGIINGNSN